MRSESHPPDCTTQLVIAVFRWWLLFYSILSFNKKLDWQNPCHGVIAIKVGCTSYAPYDLMVSTEAEIRRYFPSSPAPLPEGEGRKKIRKNLCFSTYGTGLWTLVYIQIA